MLLTREIDRAASSGAFLPAVSSLFFFFILYDTRAPSKHRAPSGRQVRPNLDILR